MSEPTAKSNLPIQRLRDRAPRSPSAVPLGNGYTDPMGRQWGTVRAMADAYGLHPTTVRRRLREGWSVARAVTPPGIEHPVTGERVTLRALAREVGISHAGMAWRAATGVDLMKAPRRATGGV